MHVLHKNELIFSYPLIKELNCNSSSSSLKPFCRAWPTTTQKSWRSTFLTRLSNYNARDGVEHEKEMRVAAIVEMSPKWRVIQKSYFSDACRAETRPPRCRSEGDRLNFPYDHLSAVSYSYTLSAAGRHNVAGSTSKRLSSHNSCLRDQEKLTMKSK